MKTLVPTLVALLPVGCSETTIEPVPGSITYGGVPRTRLQKAPIGSTVHNYVEDRGQRKEETYVVQPDRSLKLVRRELVPDD